MNHLDLSVENGVAIITFNNPPLQVMEAQTINELNALFPALEAEDVRAVVITGGDSEYFIRHFSVEQLDALTKGVPAPFDASFDDVLYRLEHLPKPVIAALNGSAAGGGFELALACDMRIAKAGPYQFGLPEITLGILPGGGGTQRLTALVGRGRSMEMMLRGRVISPGEAEKLGIVEELVSQCATETALERAVSIAQEIAARSPAAVARIKSLVRSQGAAVTQEELHRESVLFMELMATPEAKALLAKVADNHRASRETGVPTLDISTL